MCDPVVIPNPQIIAEFEGLGVILGDAVILGVGDAVILGVGVCVGDCEGVCVWLGV